MISVYFELAVMKTGSEDLSIREGRREKSVSLFLSLLSDHMDLVGITNLADVLLLYLINGLF